MAKLSQEEVKHIAGLAKIKLSGEEAEKFGSQLIDILTFVDNLARVDTSEVQPLSNVTGMKNVFREDVVCESLSQKQALSNTKSSHNGYFKIKAVFER